MNQTRIILNHLRDYQTITSMEAFSKYGCTRLADKVFRLKKEGYDIRTIMIEDTNRYGDTVRYAKYYLPKESK